MSTGATSLAIESLAPALGSRRVISLSVDCDALEHYQNFAPAGVAVPADAPADARMLERLLELFDRHRLSATFFCIANRLEVPTLRRLFQQAVAAGHRIGNHTYSHPDLGIIDPAARLGEIRRAHVAIVEHLGVTPVGFRAPAYFVTGPMLAELCGLGYRYDSSVCRSPLFDGAISAMEWLRPSFTRKVRPEPLGPLSSTAPSRMVLPTGTLIEWPIPQLLGLPFYGTLHSLLPRPLFFMQWAAARRTLTHTHYELHPIEALDAAAAREYPWVPTAALSENKRLAWLDRRLAALAAEPVVTLEELTDHYLPAVH